MPDMTFCRGCRASCRINGTAAAVLIVSANLITACRGASAADDAQQAEKFIQALNDKDVNRMMEACATPFFYRNQEWKSAPDGSGFVLGASKDVIAGNRDELRALLNEVPKTVRISAPKAVAEPPAKRELIDTHLKNVASRWSRLRIIVFLRGMGDVEHTALVGIDPGTRKVKALYVN
jgi:hypothetical protein